MGDVEAPPLLEVARAVRNPVRMLRQRVEVWTEFSQQHPPIDRRAVAHDVESAPSEVDEVAA